jgi:hypothetical protein
VLLQPLDIINMSRFVFLFFIAMTWHCRAFNPFFFIAPTTAAPTGGIAVQFQGGHTALAPTDSAGLASVAQTHWNVLTGQTWTSQALSDNTGTSTTCTISGSASGTFNGGGCTAPPTAGNTKLTSGELYDSSAMTFTFSGVPYAHFDVYVYGSGDTSGRTMIFSMTPSGGATTYFSYDNVTGSATWIVATSTWNGTGMNPGNANANYAYFPAVNASSFALAWFSPGSNSAINGIQIVQIP